MLLTFGVGLASARLRPTHHQPAKQTTVSIAAVTARKPSARLVTFWDEGEIDLTLETFLSSDGRALEYSCHERQFTYHADADLPRMSRKDGLVERAPKLNSRGSVVGERVVSAGSGKSGLRAEIEWTDGTRHYYISAPSLWYALAFERSMVWTKGSCWDFSSMRTIYQLPKHPTPGLDYSFDWDRVTRRGPLYRNFNQPFAFYFRNPLM